MRDPAQTVKDGKAVKAVQVCFVVQVVGVAKAEMLRDVLDPVVPPPLEWVYYSAFLRLVCQLEIRKETGLENPMAPRLAWKWDC